MLFRSTSFMSCEVTLMYCSKFETKNFNSFGTHIYLFVYLFMAVLGLCYCAWALSSCGEQGLLFIAVCGLLIAVASLVAEHGL